jgi:putative spermidine/putrescine transport system permease protein
VGIAQQSKSNAQLSVAASLASILFAVLLLAGLSFVSGGRRARRRGTRMATAIAPQPADLSAAQPPTSRESS